MSKSSIFIHAKIPSMIYKASLDKTSKIVTGLISLLFLLIIIFQIVLYIQYRNWPSLGTALLLLVIYTVTYLYHPVNYRIEDNNVVVHRWASDIRFSRSEIKNIELMQDKKLSGTIRTFGVGGLFGYFGQFMNRDMGCMTWYATKHRNKIVLIELINNKKIIVTPDEPEQFIHQLQLVA